MATPLANRKIGWLLGVCVLASAGSVQAASVIYEKSGFLGNFGTNSFTRTPEYTVAQQFTAVNEFQLTSPGTYKATFVDFGFSEQFEELRFSITSFKEPDKNLGEWGEGTFNFEASQSGTFYATVIGNPGNTLGIGLYGVQISSVPLPPALLLLLSSLMALGLARTKTTADTKEGSSLQMTA